MLAIAKTRAKSQLKRSRVVGFIYIPEIGVQSRAKHLKWSVMRK